MSFVNSRFYLPIPRARQRHRLAGRGAAAARRADADKMLAEALEPLKSSCDFILSDCPPALDLPTLNALAAANQALAPVDARPFTMTGVYNVLDMIHRLKRLKVFLPKPPIVSCRSKETNGRSAVISQLWETPGVRVVGSVIREDASVVTAQLLAQTIEVGCAKSRALKDYYAGALRR